MQEDVQEAKLTEEREGIVNGWSKTVQKIKLSP